MVRYQRRSCTNIKKLSSLIFYLNRTGSNSSGGCPQTGSEGASCDKVTTLPSKYGLVPWIGILVPALPKSLLLERFQLHVESALLDFIKQAGEKGAPLGGPLLRQKAEGFGDKLVEPMGTTNRWFDRCQQRNDLICRKLHGEVNDADFEGCESFLRRKGQPRRKVSSHRGPIKLMRQGSSATPNATCTFRGDSKAGEKKSRARNYNPPLHVCL